jgi:hypothetical protein
MRVSGRRSCHGRRVEIAGESLSASAEDAVRADGREAKRLQMASKTRIGFVIVPSGKTKVADACWQRGDAVEELVADEGGQRHATRPR